MTILITGSSGLIGTRLIEALAGQHPVVGTDVKPPDKPLPAGCQYLESDLTDDASVGRLLDELRRSHGERLASVIHLAAYYDFSGEPSPLYEQLTVEGTRRLLRELQSFEVEQFLFSSTLLVMRPVVKGEVLREDSPLEAEWDYPLSKQRTEQLLAAERGEIPVVIARIAGVYDEHCHSVPIGQQIKRIYERDLESYFFPGRKDHGQSFVHLEDLVTALELMVERRNTLDDYEAFLIGEPETLSYEELQEELGVLIHGQQWPTIRIPKTLAKVGAWIQEKTASDQSEVFIKPWMVDLADAHYPVDITRARQKLGWEPRYRLRDTLRPMVRHLKDDPQQFYALNKLS